MNSTRYRACVAMAVNVYVAEREDVVFFSFRLLIPSCFIKDVDSKPRGNSLEPSAGPEYSLETGHTPQVTAIRGEYVSNSSEPKGFSHGVWLPARLWWK